MKIIQTLLITSIITITSVFMSAQRTFESIDSIPIGTQFYVDDLRELNIESDAKVVTFKGPEGGGYLAWIDVEGTLYIASTAELLTWRIKDD